MPGFGLVAAGLGLAAYSALSWWLMAHAPGHAWTVLALFGPLLAGLAIAGLQRRHTPTLLACALLGALLLWVWRRGGVDVNRLYVLQHAAIHALLGWSFAITLRKGAEPLVTLLAERVHGRPLEPALRAYTRRVTVGWSLFFAVMIIASLLLYALAPWTWWSFFCTVLTPMAAVLAFVGEALWRRRRHPEFEPVSMHSAMRAWREHGQQGRA
ncbi:MAG TPA: hypothetical protein PKO45_03190 [Rubrivivax sp.]|nr:hypothetical protein [Rubrivivax sp.]